MFDISNYNIYIALYSFILNFIFLYTLFKNNITSIIDPFVGHILWISANLSFLFIFLIKYGINEIWILFIITFLEYIFFLYIFINKLIKKKPKMQTPIFLINKMEDYKIVFIYIFLMILYIYSKEDLFIYLINHSPIEWPLYRFIELQGRDPIKRILYVGFSPILIFISFYFLIIRKKYKVLVLLWLIFFAALNLVSGARSIILGLVYSFGAFVYFYRDYFSKKYINYLNIIGFIIIISSLLFASIVSLFYFPEKSLLEGFFIVFNRVFASADGLEYYLLYNGYEKIDSGLMPFAMSIFGIYIKRIFGIEYKNIGHQLSELAVGELNFAQGSNYTLPLQVMVIGYYWLPVYVFTLSFLTAKMRNLKPSSNKISVNIFKFFFVSNSFLLIADPEYGLLKILSFVIIFIPIFFIDHIRLSFKSLQNYNYCKVNK